MIRIGDFSKLSRISIRMLRYYDELGLLHPTDVDRFTGYRYYVPAQLEIAHRITALRDMGFSIAAVSDLLAQTPDRAPFEALLRVKLEEVRAQELEARSRATRIEAAIKRLEKGETVMQYDVTRKTLPQRSVASVRKVIATYQDEGTLWALMGQETGKTLQMASPAYALAIFHDEGYKEYDVDVEIQIDVVGSYENTAQVLFKTVEPIEIASAVYKGSYDQINAVNEAVAAWVSDNGYRFDGPMFNIYHVSPGHDPNPDNWVTEVCYPIAKG